MTSLATLFKLGTREIQRTWVASEIVASSLCFLLAGVASGWWTSKESEFVLAARLVFLAVALGTPGGVHRATLLENRLFLQRQPLSFGVRTVYMGYMAAARSAQLALPMGVGFAAYQRFAMGLHPARLVLDALLLGVSLFISAWVGAAVTDLVDPRAARWPWRASGRRWVGELITSHPFAAVQLATTVRTPMWTAVTLLASLLASVVVVFEPKRAVEAVMLAALVPTLRVIDEVAKDPTLPFISTFSGAVLRWVRLRCLLAVIPVLPASIVVLIQGVISRDAPVEMTLYAMFGTVSLVVATAGGAVFGVYRWQPSPLWVVQATNWIAGVGIWGATTIMVSLYTLPPEVRHPLGLGIALCISPTILAVVAYVLRVAVRSAERRDWRGASNAAH